MEVSGRSNRVVIIGQPVTSVSEVGLLDGFEWVTCQREFDRDFAVNDVEPCGFEVRLVGRVVVATLVDAVVLVDEVVIFEDVEPPVD